MIVLHHVSRRRKVSYLSQTNVPLLDTILWELNDDSIAIYDIRSVCSDISSTVVDLFDDCRRASLLKHVGRQFVDTKACWDISAKAMINAMRVKPATNNINNDA